MTATFELFNVWSQKPDWVLDAIVDGKRVRITGTTTAPALPGPSPLHVAYVDEPKGFAYRPITSSLHVLRIDVARVHIEGTFSVDDLALSLALEAALVT